MASTKLLSVDYEVFGRVQGVFFRKFTMEKAVQLNLVGWVKNTMSGTVAGTVQGPEDRVKTMKHWLRYEGSVYSRIEKADFKNEKTIDKLQYASFTVKGDW